MNTPSLGQTVIHSLCNWKQKWPSNANRIYHIFNHWAQNSVFLEPINFKVLLITLRFVIVYESKRKQLPRFNVCAVCCLFYILFRFLVCFSCCECITSAKWNDGKTLRVQRDLTTCFTDSIKIDTTTSDHTKTLSNHHVRTVFNSLSPCILQQISLHNYIVQKCASCKS